jgi:hypothetical protein
MAMNQARVGLLVAAALLTLPIAAEAQPKQKAGAKGAAAEPAPEPAGDEAAEAEEGAADAGGEGGEGEPAEGGDDGLCSVRSTQTPAKPSTKGRWRLGR